METHEELVAKLNVWYPEAKFLGEFEQFIYVEKKLLALAKCDDLTPFEQEKLAVLPQVQAYFN